MKEVCNEFCPYCDTEVELPITLGKYKCPNCGHQIINCSMCINMDCKNCSL